MITRRMRIRRQILSAFLHVEHEEELMRTGVAAAEDDLVQESHLDRHDPDLRDAQVPGPLLHLKGDG